MSTTQIIKLPGFEISNKSPFTLIAGPCQMESRDHAMFMAESIKAIADKLEINVIYKSSFDKANRTSISGIRGIGMKKALPVFEEIKKEFEMSVLTDVHSEVQCREAAEVVDILQIPAFLCRQTDMLIAAGNTHRIINVKKGQFLAPWDIKNVIEKIASTGNNKVMVTERGVSFGYNTLVTDMRSLAIMADTGYPVVFDATHSVQQPGGKGNESGGDRRFVEVLAKAAVAVGVAAVFMEVHEDPDNAPSDGPCMVRLDNLEKLLKKLMAYDEITKS